MRSDPKFLAAPKHLWLQHAIVVDVGALPAVVSKRADFEGGSHTRIDLRHDALLFPYKAWPEL